MNPIGLFILLAVLLSAGLALRSLLRDGRRTGMSRARSVLRTALGGALFFVVMVATAVVIARVVGGPGAPDNCAGDECDAGMAVRFALILLGLPAGIAAGWLATVGLRRVWR